MEKINNTPPAAMEPQAAMAAWATIEKPKHDRDRFALLALLNTVVSGGLVAALILMQPLKTVTPYLIEAESNGKTRVIGAASANFNPTQAQVIYFISEWTQALWAVDKNLTTRGLESAFAKTRGKGSDVFRQHVASYKAIERSAADPNLSSSVEVKTVNFVDDDTALVRFSVTERRKGKPAIEDIYMMTLHWVIQPPKTVEDIMKNPIGFYVTDFSWSKEVKHDK